MEKQQLVFCPPTSIRMNWLSSWSYGSVPCNVSVETAEMLADVPNIAGELTATGDGFNGLKSHSCVWLQIRMSVGFPFYSPKFHVCWLNPPPFHRLKSRKSGRPTQVEDVEEPLPAYRSYSPSFVEHPKEKETSPIRTPFRLHCLSCQKGPLVEEEPGQGCDQRISAKRKANIWLYNMLISFCSPMLMIRVNKAYPRRIYLKEPGEIRMTWELWDFVVSGSSQWPPNSVWPFQTGQA